MASGWRSAIVGLNVDEDIWIYDIERDQKTLFARRPCLSNTGLSGRLMVQG